jgi:hypothetical protein
MRYDTIPSTIEGEFKAMAQGKTDYVVDVFVTNTIFESSLLLVLLKKLSISLKSKRWLSST